MNDYWKKARGEKVTSDERQLLYNLAGQIAEKFDNPTIINIGVSWGASLHCLVAGAPDANHIAIDIDYDKRPVQNKELLEIENVAFCKGDSAKYTIASDLHLVFVDGCHSYECVKNDIRNFTPHIPVGGMIVFHDYKAKMIDRKRFNIQVWQAVREWRKGNEGWKEIYLVDSAVAFERIK